MKKILITMILICLSSLPNQLIAQWVQTTGPGGGAILCLNYDGKNVYAGTKGGIYRSTDQGINWQNVGLKNRTINALKCYKSFVFVGTTGGMYYSTDYGENWDEVRFGLYAYNTFAIEIHDENILVCTYGHGMYRSTDNGSSWTEINNGITDKNIYTIFVNENYVYIGTENGNIFISSDNGDTWSRADNGLPGLTVFTLIEKDKYLFAGTVGGGVFYSTDNGNNWIAANNNLTNRFVSSFAIINQELFAGTYAGGIFRTTDNGLNWIAANSNPINPYINSLLIIDSKLYAGTDDAGVYVSSDLGSNWVASNNNLVEVSVENLAVDSNILYAASYGAGVFYSTDNGATWKEINSGLTNPYINTLLISGSDLFCGVANVSTSLHGNVFFSSNNGSSWSEVNKGLTQHSINALTILGTTIFAGTNNYVYRSTNYGASWNRIINGMTNPNVNTFAIIDSNLFAGTDGGVFMSTDYGENWKHVDSSFENWEDKSIHTLFANGSELFAGTFTGMFSSKDKVDNWTKLNIESSDFIKINAITAKNNNIFAGDWTNGVFLSADDGINWVQINNGLLNGDIESIAINDQYLFVGTLRGSVWRRPLSEIIPTPNASMFLSQTSIDFGDVTLGSKKSETIIIKNTGNTPLIISEISELQLNSYFSFANKMTIPDEISPGSQDSLILIFAPLWTEEKSTSFSIIHNAQGSPTKINLHGTGVHYTSVDDDNEPVQFSLSQNYPNPFNPTTEIDFSIANGCNVTLKIFNMLGQEIETLVNNYKDKGRYKVKWDAEGNPSGIYFYRLHAGTYTSTKKLILIR